MASIIEIKMIYTPCQIHSSNGYKETLTLNAHEYSYQCDQNLKRCSSCWSYHTNSSMFLKKFSYVSDIIERDASKEIQPRLDGGIIQWIFTREDGSVDQINCQDDYDQFKESFSHLCSMVPLEEELPGVFKKEEMDD